MPCDYKAFRYGPCVTRGFHSFICHPHTKPYLPLLPRRRHHRLAACKAATSTACVYSWSRLPYRKFCWLHFTNESQRRRRPTTCWPSFRRWNGLALYSAVAACASQRQLFLIFLTGSH